jgi:hypothetical protein
MMDLPTCLSDSGDRTREERVKETAAWRAMTTACFTYHLQWIGDRKPGRKGSGVQIGGPPISVELDCTPRDLHEGNTAMQCALWRAEAQFLDHLHHHYPHHSAVHWEARVGNAEGPLMSEFRSGFTIAE